MIEKYYEEYGRLMIQAEIVQAKISDVKTKIAQELSKASVTTPQPAKAEAGKGQENGK